MKTCGSKSERGRRRNVKKKVGEIWRRRVGENVKKQVEKCKEEGGEMYRRRWRNVKDKVEKYKEEGVGGKYWICILNWRFSLPRLFLLKGKC